MSTQRVFTSSTADDCSTTVVANGTDAAVDSVSLNKHERYLRIKKVTDELTQVLAESSDVQFERRMKVLKDILRFWKNGQEVKLVISDEHGERLSQEELSSAGETIITSSSSNMSSPKSSKRGRSKGFDSSYILLKDRHSPESVDVRKKQKQMRI